MLGLASQVATIFDVEVQPTTAGCRHQLLGQNQVHEPWCFTHQVHRRQCPAHNLSWICATYLRCQESCHPLPPRSADGMARPNPRSAGLRLVLNPVLDRQLQHNRVLLPRLPARQLLYLSLAVQDMGRRSRGRSMVDRSLRNLPRRAARRTQSDSVKTGRLERHLRTQPR